MRFIIRRKKQKVDVGNLVIEKALEQARVRAQVIARGILCEDCLDRRCQTGSVCKAFFAMTDSIAWDITAGNAEEN